MKLVVIGAGGHAKVVTDTAQMSGWQVIGFADDNPNAKLFDLPYLGRPSQLELPTDVHVVIAIGSNQIRQKIHAELLNRFNWATVIHPKAIISSRAVLNSGTVVFAGAVIQADTVVGHQCIVNSCASIDHDCQIADYCHVAPNTTLAGGVTLETGAFIGAGSVVTPNRRIGAWTTLGAGGVAIHDLAANQTFVGVPAKNIRST
jgi:sugar O-acyltransferase (sialic acid O-acetyltransferase NeuD family)